MKAVFLDRDGVINEYPGDFNYVTNLQEFHLLPGVGEALKKMNSKGYKLFVVSNQAGVSKGIYSQEILDGITSYMLEALKSDGAEISGVYYCTHRDEDECSCRKPKTGLVSKAIDDLKESGVILDIKSSYFIGDTMRDIETGKKAGLKTILVFSGKEKPENKKAWKYVPDFAVADLNAAVHIIS